jgi:hypothetical protein
VIALSNSLDTTNFTTTKLHDFYNVCTYNVYKHLQNFNIHTIHEPSMLTTLMYVTFDTKHIQALAITTLSVYKLQIHIAWNITNLMFTTISSLAW